MIPTVRIHSIFRSIQGESTRAGLPCAFVRLAGCPLSCSYCDTVLARTSEGIPTSVDEVLLQVRKLDTGLVEVTGGEPLAQPGALELLAALAENGYEVLLETSGAFPIAAVDPRVRVVMDVKTPGSGMSDRLHAENLERLTRERHEVKFVVTSRADFDWTVDFVRCHGLDTKCEILVSAAVPVVTHAELADWVLQCGLPLRFQVQLHKIVWPNTPAGVER